MLTAADVEALRIEVEAELEEDLEADPEIEEALRDEASRDPLAYRKAVTPTPDPEVVYQVERAGEGRGGSLVWLAARLAKVVYRTVKRYMNKRDHGFPETVVEEVLREFYLANLGAWVWEGMKTSAELMWASNEGRAGATQHVGTYFLHRLADLQAARRAASAPEIHVDLVGHSAGSIVICHLLRMAAERHPELRFRNVVFLAPACTLDLFRNEVVERTDRFGRFRMFTMSDHYESKDALVPRLKAIYPRSLLYFISGVLEDEADKPLAGLERYLRRRPPYNTESFTVACNFLSAPGEDRLALSVTADGTLDGLRSGSITHGGFDDEATLVSLQHLIKS